MIAHLSPVIEGIIGGVGAMVVWEGAKTVLRAIRRNAVDNRLSTLLSEQSKVLKEVQEDRQACREERQQAESRIGALETSIDELKVEVRGYKRELETSNEAARIAMVSQQGHLDARQAAETKLAEALVQLKAANAYATELRAIIKVSDPEHPILTVDARPAPTPTH